MKKQKYRQGRKRRMKKFKLNEISLVDRPAQEGALAVFEKFNDEDFVPQTDEDIEKFMAEYAKLRGPRNGETFEQFFLRMRMTQTTLPEDVARAIFDSFNPNIEDDGNMSTKNDDVKKQRGSFPSPREGETRGAFISRIVSDPQKREEFPNRQQLLAAAISMFQRSRANKQEGEDKDEEDNRRRRRRGGGDVEKRFGILSTVNGHSHIIDIVGQHGILSRGMSSMTDDHTHDWVRRDDGTVIILTADDHTHEVMESVVISEDRSGNMDKLFDESQSDAESANRSETDNSNGGGEIGKKDEVMTDELKKAQERLTALESEKENLEKVAGLSGVHKAHYDSLDEEAKKSFLDQSDEDKTKAVKAAEAAKQDENPVVYTADDGTEYHKSDDPRLVKMAQGRDEDRKESIRLQKAAEDADLTKRAEGDLANFPGDTDVRKAILKAVDGIEDADIRGKAQDALKAHNARLHSAFQEVGTNGVPNIEKSDGQKGAEAELDRLAKERASKEGEDFFTAYEKVSDANPQLVAKAVAG